jgi:hypothetical protein
MKRPTRCLCSVASIVVMGMLGTQSAQAQVQQYGLNPANRPAVSPYINLIRSGSSPAINYYGIVRPEIAYANSLYQLQGQQGALATQLQQEQAAAATALPATGHKSGFMTQSRYFMSTGGQTTQGRTFAGAGGVTLPAAVPQAQGTAGTPLPGRQ